MEDLLYSVLAGADTVGNADATVAVSRECQGWQMLAQALDTVETFEVADAILRHGGLPLIDAGEERRGAEAEDLLQFISNDGDDGVVGKLPDVFGIRSGKGAAQQTARSSGAR